MNSCERHLLCAFRKNIVQTSPPSFAPWRGVCLWGGRSQVHLCLTHWKVALSGDCTWRWRRCVHKLLQPQRSLQCISSNAPAESMLECCDCAWPCFSTSVARVFGDQRGLRSQIPSVSKGGAHFRHVYDKGQTEIVRGLDRKFCAPLGSET